MKKNNPVEIIIIYIIRRMIYFCRITCYVHSMKSGFLFNCAKNALFWIAQRTHFLGGIHGNKSLASARR